MLKILFCTAIPTVFWRRLLSKRLERAHIPGATVSVPPIPDLHAPFSMYVATDRLQQACPVNIYVH